MPKKQMKLGAFLYPTGHHVAAWRHPQAAANAGSSIAHYREIAQVAEHAKFDMIFLADGAGTRGTEADLPALSRTATRYVAQFEPLTLLSSLAAVTSHVGLVATATTTYNEPYHVARKFASLDHLSGGRAGWNLVTSTSPYEAENFGSGGYTPHAQRYERAREFADVVRGLWDSWDDDAFVRDKESGVFFSPEKLHVLHHKGRHFSVRGPLNVARSPQGHPVMVQAGSSEPGKDLAAATAEVIFTAQVTLADAQSFYRDVKGRLAGYGRQWDHLKIMPGVFPVVGRTRQEANDKFEQLQDLIHPEVGLSLLQATGGLDLRGHDLDGPLPDELPPTEGGKSRQQLLIDLARRENLTIRQLYLKIAGARGHWQIVGTPADIADQLQERFEGEGADGFNVMPPYLPGGLVDFVELVLPELRRRGLFRTDYEGPTLRDNLGLPRPAIGGWAPAARAFEHAAE
ncbi:FMN-dependent oxidoreductase, nitrilotriacetate monooxygenase family [Arboricoccus pini]|uniref:FMN-dependent oxidoreductase, nitrilotriacetate monooxygenase family n=1 Tax=Arboricoccus pini TaxID=1963835 RepID=A0A212RFQ3_9PROT|nr:LLM class flavin-dependent oxidoreductase [Arboricoccus pini]SNB71118.1 FMN-dependent oxidoreductase, nitrilotriacetate monooxygenase family [Arboricoccus pini]